jgi:hypothetical protein
VNDYWTTADKQKIPYSELTDSHLRAIICDGYRNAYITDEAAKRGFDVPLRPVDKLSAGELAMWIESFASCGIEGNSLGDMMMNLWNTDKDLFFFRLNQVLEKESKNDQP